MKRLGPFHREHAAARHALGSGFAVLLFLALQLLAVSPHLHHELHADSHQPDHQCAIKLLSDGQVDIASGFVTVAEAAPGFAAPPEIRTVLPVAADHQLPPSRGPPSLLT